jgi:capsular polysaccharide transport system ATP-binding protein
MLILDRVSKVYEYRGGSKTVLHEASTVIRRGQRLGILGRNGAGKSTLVRMLGGVEQPTSGRILRRMSISWPIAAGIGVQGALSGADNTRFIARIYNAPVDRTLAYVEAFAELGPYFRMPANTYSGGMMGRLLMGISLAIDFDCYLIDEATGAGDQRFLERTRQALAERTRDRGIIMVSHIPTHLKTYCTTGAVLSDGRLTFYEDLDEAIAAYKAL